MNININIDTSEVDAALTALAQRCQNRQPLMRHLSQIIESGIQDNFAAGGRPAWLGVARGGIPLTLSGHLKNSFTNSAFHDNDTAGAGTNVVYAGIHNYGGQTKPHVIVPRHKKALAFGGRVVKKVNHPGSKIPQREFLKLTQSEWDEISHTINRYLENGF